MKITVTATDIKNGIPKDDCNCPVAKALKRKTHKKIKINWGQIQIKDKIFPQPQTVRKFINRFDQYEKVKPFSFEL